MKDCFYTTGAYIERVEISPGYWRWVVQRFEDDTYHDGENCGVLAFASTAEGLIADEEDQILSRRAYTKPKTSWAWDYARVRI